MQNQPTRPHGQQADFVRELTNSLLSRVRSLLVSIRSATASIAAVPVRRIGSATEVANTPHSCFCGDAGDEGS